MAAALQLLDLLADSAGFFFGIPGAGDGDLLAVDVLGAQSLAEPAFIIRDQMRGGGEDVAGGAVVALQPDNLGAGKIVLEAQDVVDLRAAPAIDRLVVVADAADVLRGLRRSLADQAQPSITGSLEQTVSGITLQVSGPESVDPGMPFSITVTPIDEFGNPDPAYTGTLSLSISDSRCSTEEAMIFMTKESLPVTR